MGMRSRSRGQFYPSTWKFQYTRNGPTSPSGFYDGKTTWTDEGVNTTSSGIVELMTDVVGRGSGRRTSSTSEWVNNPAEKSKSVLTNTDQSVQLTSVATATGQYLTALATGDMMSFYLGSMSAVGFDLSLESKASNNAWIQCLSRIEPPKAQSIVSMAEAHKTVDLIADRVRKLAAIAAACRSGKRKLVEALLPGVKPAKRPRRYIVWDEAGRPIVRKDGKVVRRYGHRVMTPKKWSSLSTAARLWLEYRYGWTPLVLDIVDQAKAFYASEDRKDLIQRAYKRVVGIGDAEKSSKTTSTVTVSGSTRRFTYETVNEQSCSVRAYAYYRETYVRGGFPLQRLNDYGIFDVPRAIWELAPGSFIADWIAPIGDWLQALTPKFGVETFIAGATTRKSNLTKRTLTGFQWVGPTPASAGSFTASPIQMGATNLREESSWKRTTGYSLPTYPPISVNLNAKRVVDAIALLAGAAKTADLRI